MRNRCVLGDTETSEHRRFTVSILLVVLCFGQMIAKQSDHPYASTKVLNEATIFAKGIVSTGSYEFAPAFTPDGKTLYYQLQSQGNMDSTYQSRT